MYKKVLPFLVLPGVLMFGGCASSPAPTESSTSDSVEGLEFVEAPGTEHPLSKMNLALLVGMHKENILLKLGEPTSIRTLDPPESKAELWTYRRTVDSVAKSVESGMQDVPKFDPTSETYRMVREPVYSTQIQNLEMVTILVMVNDRFTNFEQYLERPKPVFF